MTDEQASTEANDQQEAETTQEQTTEQAQETEQAGKSEASQSDWRDDLAAGAPEDVQRKFRKSLDKFSSLKDVGENLAKLRKGFDSRVELPGDGATEDDHKSFAKALGWPGDAKEGDDAVKAYGYERPDSIGELLDAQEIGETEAILFSAAQADMVPPRYAKWAMDKYYTVLEEAESAKLEFAENANKETMAMLEKEWGAEKDTNLKYANDFIAKYGGNETVDILNLPLEDGRMIGDIPAIVQALAVGGRATSEMDAFGGENNEAKRMSYQSEIDAFKERELKGETLTESERKRKSELFGLVYGHAPVDGRVSA